MYNPDTISVICATYNRPKSLLHILEQLSDQRCVNLAEDVDVVIVDDGSSQSMTNDLKAYPFQFQYIYRERHPQNLARVYSSRNMAVAHSRGRYVLQLDDDLEFSPYLLNIVQACAGLATGDYVWCARISNNSDVDTNGGFSRGKDGRWYDGQCKWQETHWQSSTSAGMFMPRTTWNKLGGYDEQFDLCMGAADQELALRVQKLGDNPGDVRVFIAPYFVNIADEETGSWRMEMIDRRVRQQRNEGLFWIKHPDADRWTNV
jgi:GT2 family glycosyltransferase